jgi:hypothetical protein
MVIPNPKEFTILRNSKTDDPSVTGSKRELRLWEEYVLHEIIRERRDRIQCQLRVYKAPMMMELTDRRHGRWHAGCRLHGYL